mmetsp:Transcript_116162/g.333576  ORF Transcript_116162/g.333576 Transcript_116162/m.333576 type:complete len:336 (+) Transcript_116162:91-1098(+)|eukprot:CAMPEP_0170212908 /NCGR_PEP_ID=MMETSP0116_2-20130129/6076_1 /TAXON_ID=400756 /ORGANISM="Durinskia baltica, Strain CSIRO CS-38" /LENGTH=335 /DNA_ID=CAMNT_0010463455 /DNA_START=52 /DNA_END=1059 /DNA_ORIENTATION=+
MGGGASSGHVPVVNDERILDVVRCRGDHGQPRRQAENRFVAALLSKCGEAATEKLKEHPRVRKLFADVEDAASAAGGWITSAGIIDFVSQQKADVDDMLAAMDNMVNAALLKQDAELRGAVDGAMRDFFSLRDVQTIPITRLASIHQTLTRAASQMMSRLKGQLGGSRTREADLYVATLFLAWRQAALFHLLALQAGHDEFPESFPEAMLAQFSKAYSAFHADMLGVYLDARCSLLTACDLGGASARDPWLVLQDSYTTRIYRISKDARGLPFEDRKISNILSESLDSQGRVVKKTWKSHVVVVANLGHHVIRDYIEKDVENFDLLALRPGFQQS